MTERPIDEIKAGDAFRSSLIERADYMIGSAPIWYGWAIMDAFLAGIDYARKSDADGESVSEDGNALPSP